MTGRKDVRSLIAVDAYGRVLLTLLAAIGWTIAAPDEGWAQAVGVVLLGGTVYVAFGASGVQRRTSFAGIALWVAATITAAVGAAAGLGTGVSSGVGLVLIGGSLVAIVRRLASHPVVTARTVLGAVTVYLLIGTFFTFLYAVVDAVGTSPALRGLGEVGVRDTFYFSFVTLTTVGFGDVVPATETVRAFAVLEALIGQLYLVTVVALTVSRIGATRGGRGAGRGEDPPSRVDR